MSTQNQKTTDGPQLRPLGRQRGLACSDTSPTRNQLANAEPVEQPGQSHSDQELAQQPNLALHVQEDPSEEAPMSEITIAPFYGNPGDRADLWLVDYHDYCKCKGLSGERSRTSFRFFLKEHAKQWYLSLSEDIRNNHDLLVERFKVRFNGSDGGCSITSVKQSLGESCSSYFTRFLAATNQKEYPSDLLVQFALEGLIEPIKHTLMLQNLSDFDSIRLAALRAEKAISAQTCTVSAATPNRVDELAEKLDRLTDILLSQRTEGVNAVAPTQRPNYRNRPSTNQQDGQAERCRRCNGKGFADKRKKKVQHEYLRMMSKERKKAQHTQQTSNSNQRFSSCPDYKQTNYKRKWESADDNRFGSKRQSTEESDSSRLGETSTQNIEGEPVGDLRFNRHIPEESFSRSQDGRKGFRKKHDKDPSERNDNIFSKAMDEANARRKEAKHKREQKQKEREERQRALEQYRKKKKDNYFKFHCKKTNKGQPVMKYQMEFLLQKIMERKEKDKK